MSAQKSKILVVDDSSPDRELLKEILEQAGNLYEVWTVNSGKLALALMEQVPPDVILLDIQMAEVNGFETLQEMKKRGKSVPVLLVSAFTEKDDRLKGLEYGAIDFIDKPINPDVVRARVAVQIKMNRIQGHALGHTPGHVHRVSRPAGDAAAAAHDPVPARGRETDQPKPPAMGPVGEFKVPLLAAQETLQKILSGQAGELNVRQKELLAESEKNISRLIQMLGDQPRQT